MDITTVNSETQDSDNVVVRRSFQYMNEVKHEDQYRIIIIVLGRYEKRPTPMLELRNSRRILKFDKFWLALKFKGCKENCSRFAHAVAFLSFVNVSYDRILSYVLIFCPQKV